MRANERCTILVLLLVCRGGATRQSRKGATGRPTWLVERRHVPELSALNPSLRRSTGGRSTLELSAAFKRALLSALNRRLHSLNPR